MKQIMLTTTALVLAQMAYAKDTTYIGSVELITGDTAADAARGTVFIDENRNSKLDDDEVGLAGVQVSNGREVVLTGEDGTYELPAYDDMNLFVTKPAGHATPVDADMIPQFAYVHKVDGSPDLRFGGIEPTGPLPQAINFPLIEDGSGDQFNCLIFGDTQPYTNREIGYVRDTAGKMLAARDNSNTECLIFAGDVMGDDLSLYPRFKKIIAVGGVPQYYVGGNHDVDFDAADDEDSFDTFRREWGPEYWSADIGNVHFVGLDNVRYPCNGVDPHPFCAANEDLTYNGVVSGRQLEWLKNDLANVPQDKLIVMTAHIPFQTFTDNDAAKHQTDNLDELVAVLGDRPVLGLSGHTHTTENIEKGESFDGWEANTNLAEAPFHQIVTGAVSGSWWAGDLNDQGVPHATQRLGAPRGYYQLDFDGSDYVDTYKTFHLSEDNQLHASFSTPRFREWAERLIAYRELYQRTFDQKPPVVLRDLGDMYMLTQEDLADGSWVAVNVWNGSQQSQVSISINGETPIEAARTQDGTGEAKLEGVDYADPLALAKQSTQGSVAAISVDGGEETAGFTTWKGTSWAGHAGPFQNWMLTDSSHHLWRADLPQSLPTGLHKMQVTTTDRHGRTFSETYAFEVVEELPNPEWQDDFWN
ncbi:calcineurin-like phosphoesterase C-terminal domain-containing protein [Actibacterium sp. 188UL27-1]|uniref:calcineurin-like phosphoesterase C-terminal domain-containing protein n=1 Tax=Actibacterium sp. 188UL27-1 TaxID=2786961 RepID=UPI00195D7324|nr:calcineurin-like phosphoesterase C-terminal domain-containing protein [Actibacterium sp. 188UL27-1]MBM7070126.1 calcineurin-like phosphoesterase C-terminal domain-containing protein [Actibacterium sp. 188UL27-1]